MKSKSNKVFWDDSWLVWSFPKRDKTIVYNAKTKKYNFYNGIPKEKETLKEVILKNKQTQSQSDTWRRTCMYLAAALGISLGIIVFHYMV